MSSPKGELSQFGLDPNSSPDQQQWAGICRFAEAVLTNPHIQFGDRNSQIVFPSPVRFEVEEPFTAPESSSSSSGSSDGSSDVPSSEGGSSEGSDKSTAIVPASWSPTGYVALFIAEMPEVRFDDVVSITVRGRRQVVALDRRFTAVCHPGSIVLCGRGTDNGRPARVWLTTTGQGVVQLHIEVSRWSWRRPGSVHVRLSGIRKGFAGKRFPFRTHAQFVANEAFINSAYPGS